MSGDRRAYGCCVQARQPGLPGALPNISHCGMTKPDPAKSEAARDARLAAALRDNLRRRKQQARDDQTKDDPRPASE